MECMPIHLHERTKSNYKPSKIYPRRYCHRRLVDPEFEEGWTREPGHQRFRFHNHRHSTSDESVENNTSEDTVDIYLTVQNLKFSGDSKLTVRPKTSFQYKSLSDDMKHRMFVKRAVCDSYTIDDRYSPLSCYYLDNLSNYIKSCDIVHSTSEKSNLISPKQVSQSKVNKEKSSKALVKRFSKVRLDKDNPQNSVRKITKLHTQTAEKKEAFPKADKKKTEVTRTQSPETVQVIRVEILRNDNNSGSATPDYNDFKNLTVETDIEIDHVDCFNIKRTGIANTSFFHLNNMKQRDDHQASRKRNDISFMCKSFKLSFRSREANSKALNTKKLASRI